MDISPEIGSVIGLASGLLLALAAWALQRQGQARDREMATAVRLESVRTTIEHISKDVGSMRGQISALEELIREMSDATHRETQQTAIGMSELRATIAAHVAMMHGHEQQRSANGRAV